MMYFLEKNDLLNMKFCVFKHTYSDHYNSKLVYKY